MGVLPSPLARAIHSCNNLPYYRNDIYLYETTTECSSSDDEFAEQEVNALKDCTNPTHMKTNPPPLVHVEQDLNTDGSGPSKISKALTAMYM